MNTELVLVETLDRQIDQAPTLAAIWQVEPGQADMAMLQLWYRLRDQWLKMQRSAATRTSYATATEQWLEWLVERNLLPWQAVSGHVRAWLDWLVHSGKSASTVNQRLSAAASWYQFVINEVHMVDGVERSAFFDANGNNRANPFKVGNLKRPKVTQYDKAHPLSDGQVNALVTDLQSRMNTLTGARNYALIISHLLTASRGSEIVRLQWKDIRPNRNQKGSFVFDWSGKGDKNEKTPFPTFAYDAIVNYLKIAGRWIPGHPDDIQDDDYIFTALVTHGIANLNHVDPDDFDADNPAARHLSPRSANRIFQSSLRRAGIEDWAKHRLHDAKHTTARKHHELFRDIEKTREFAHHESIATTGIYLRNMNDPIDDYSDAFLRSWGIS